jgi:outer membrane biosynthesis protein TonB
MKSILFALLSIFLTTHCSTPESQDKIPFQVSEQVNEKECDFSAYKPVTVSHFLQTSLKTRVKPIYPSEAIRRGIRGKISVKILVDRDGNVVKACALNGEDVLRSVAEDAALKWKFNRNVIVGRESFVEDGIAFNFVLEKNNSDDEETVFP